MKQLGTRRRVLLLLGLSAVMVFSMFAPVPAHGQAQPLLTRHMREAVLDGQARWMRRLPTTQVLRLNIALPLRDEWELDRLLQQLYDPQSPIYHQFLSVNTKSHSSAHCVGFVVSSSTCNGARLRRLLLAAL